MVIYSVIHLKENLANIKLSRHNIGIAILGTRKLFLILFGIRNMLGNVSDIAQNSQRDGIDVGLTSGSLMISPVLSRGKILVSTWNEEAAHRLRSRATHTKRESTSTFGAPNLASWSGSPQAQTVTTEAATCSPRGPRVSLVK